MPKRNEFGMYVETVLYAQGGGDGGLEKSISELRCEALRWSFVEKRGCALVLSSSAEVHALSEVAIDRSATGGSREFCCVRGCTRCIVGAVIVVSACCMGRAGGIAQSVDVKMDRAESSALKSSSNAS